MTIGESSTTFMEALLDFVAVALLDGLSVAPSPSPSSPIAMVLTFEESSTTFMEALLEFVAVAPLDGSDAPPTYFLYLCDLRFVFFRNFNLLL